MSELWEFLSTESLTENSIGLLIGNFILQFHWYKRRVASVKKNCNSISRSITSSEVAKNLFGYLIFSRANSSSWMLKNLRKDYLVSGKLMKEKHFKNFCRVFCCTLILCKSWSLVKVFRIHLSDSFKMPFACLLVNSIDQDNLHFKSCFI